MDEASGALGEVEPAEEEFGERLAAAIRARGVTLQWLAGRLRERSNPVSVSTLSYWRSGQRRPERGTSLDAIAELESLLGLSPGELTALVGPSRRPAPDRSRPFDVLVERPLDEDEVRRVIDDPVHRQLFSNGGQLAVDLDREGRVCLTSNRMMWHARVDGAQRAVIWLKVDDPTPDPPDLRVVAGGRLGRVLWSPASGMYAAELVLDRALRRGETAVTEHQFVGVQGDVEERQYELVVLRPSPESVLWVRFHPERLPSTCTVYEQREGGVLDEREVEPVGTGVHHVVRGFGPGRFGIRWTW